MYCVGINWANEKHDICILDTAGTVVKQFAMVHSLAGFQQLERQVLKRGAEQAQLNIERSDGLLVDWIMAHGWTLHITPTVVVARRRPRGAKTDSPTPFCWPISFGCGIRTAWLLTCSSPTILHLRELVRALDNTLEEQRRLGNRMRHILLQYFPSALKLFTRTEHLITLAFLDQFPTQAAARGLPP